jgi:hypothetical protein
MSLIPGQSATVSEVFGSILTNTSGTLSLTTTANQRVVVWAKGRIDTNANGRTIELKYNGVTKDTVVVDGGGGGSSNLAWALMYSETPGAGTHNITVVGTGGGLSNIMIIAMLSGQ